MQTRVAYAENATAESMTLPPTPLEFGLDRGVPRVLTMLLAGGPLVRFAA